VSPGQVFWLVGRRRARPSHPDGSRRGQWPRISFRNATFPLTAAGPRRTRTGFPWTGMISNGPAPVGNSPPRSGPPHHEKGPRASQWPSTVAHRQGCGHGFRRSMPKVRVAGARPPGFARPPTTHQVTRTEDRTIDSGSRPAVPPRSDFRDAPTPRPDNDHRRFRSLSSRRTRSRKGHAARHRETTALPGKDRRRPNRLPNEPNALQLINKSSRIGHLRHARPRFEIARPFVGRAPSEPTVHFNHSYDHFWCVGRPNS
jgi:hypothetical protein